MSQKRKLEEYHDPDYPQLVDPKRVCPDNAIDKLEKIRSIIIREFQHEMSTKEKEIIEIDNRLSITKKLLHQVRYGVVSQYYHKKNLIINPNDVNVPSILQNDSINGKQTAIHPSLKKILGTKLEDYDELLKIRSPRQAAKTAQTTIKEKLKTKKEKRLERLRIDASNTVIRHEPIVPIPPPPTTTTTTTILNTSNNKIYEDNSIKINNHWDKPIATLNEGRGGNYTRNLIVVGNTSKYIGYENSSDNVTHKWLIYVHSKTSIPIGKFIRKIRFFLHPSYKPNDIIDVNSLPFQLSRRGWGEFPVRLQLFFHSQLKQKPVQLVHNLILDKKLTGLQTLGAETLVEIWLRSNIFKPAETVTRKEYEENNKNEEIDNIPNILSTTTNIEKNLFEFLEQIENPSISSDIDNIEPSLLLSPNQHFIISELLNPKLKNDLNNSPILLNENKTMEIKELSNNIKETNSKLIDLGICGNINDENSINSNKDEQNLMKINKFDLNNTENELKLNETSSDNINNKILISNKNNIVFKNGKMYIIDPLQAKLKLKQKHIQQESLLKPQISLLKTNNQLIKNIDYNPLKNDHDYTPKRNHTTTEIYDKKLNNDKLNDLQINQNIITNKKLITSKKSICLMKKSRHNYREEFENQFLMITFLNSTKAIIYLFKHIPLINNLAIQSDYRISFPFVIRNYDIYKNYNTPKRRAIEWLQSKYFSQLMKQHNQFNDTFWTTKEIILYARSYSFTPLITDADEYALKNLLINVKNDQLIDTNRNDLTDLNDIDKWIEENMKYININKESDDIIDIINDDICIKSEKINLTPIKDYGNKFWLPIDEIYDDEATLISNICFEIGLRLQPEELQTGVMHESVKLILILAMRYFIEEVIRKSVSKQYEENCNLNSLLECKHITEAITTQKRFDFLTNQYFYVKENNIKNENELNSS